MNANKTKLPVGRPRITLNCLSTPALNCIHTGVGRTYSSNNRHFTACHLCGLELQRKSMNRHLINQHQSYEQPPQRNRISHIFQTTTSSYTISMDNNTYTQCLVPSCTRRYKTRISMRQHFQNRHWNDAILINEEGQLPQCNKCLLFTSNALSLRQQNSKSGAAGQARRERREQQLNNEQGESATITIKGTAVKNVDSFRYLGRILTANGDDQLAIAYNLQKAKKSWKRVQTILR
jgi:hypothetical protein